MALAAGDGGDDVEGFGAAGDFFGEGDVGGVVGEVLIAGVEADHGAAFEGGVVAEGAGEGGEFLFEGVEDAGGGDRGIELELDFALDVGEGAEVDGEDDADHGSLLGEK